jgi:protein-L-isoaspartate(D-aspartate) O-methyltransferase
MSASAAYDRQRREMVEQQLARRGIANPRVLAALGTIPREVFLPIDSQREAYHDRALSIDCGQTISQPYIVALMTDALQLAGHQRVLEIGTGSGYQTAILAQLAAEVITVERHPSLAQSAADTLRQLGIRNVRMRVGDGTLGSPDDAPFDAIIVTAAARQVPPPLLAQLVEGGRLVIPVGDDRSQTLEVIHKLGCRTTTTRLTGCRFVPLIGFCAPDNAADSRDTAP